MKMDNNESKTPVGMLFDTINYYSVEDLEKFIASLTKEQALYCLTQAVQAAYRRQSYTLAESETISKCLRLLSMSVE
jgi:tRNA(Leu) C34 or U34 (ribose-2'-O)-methylase TrmL